MLVYVGRDGIYTWVFSSRELLDCLLDYFIAGWSVEIGVCLNLPSGMQAIALALISAGLLRTALKCSAHLFRMAGLSVISVVAFTLSNGDVRDDCGP